MTISNQPFIWVGAVLGDPRLKKTARLNLASKKEATDLDLQPLCFSENCLSLELCVCGEPFRAQSHS